MTPVGYWRIDARHMRSRRFEFLAGCLDSKGGGSSLSVSSLWTNISDVFDSRSDLFVLCL